MDGLEKFYVPPVKRAEWGGQQDFFFNTVKPRDLDSKIILLSRQHALHHIKICSNWG